MGIHTLTVLLLIIVVQVESLYNQRGEKGSLGSLVVEISDLVRKPRRRGGGRRGGRIGTSENGPGPRPWALSVTVSLSVSLPLTRIHLAISGQMGARSSASWGGRVPAERAAVGGIGAARGCAGWLPVSIVGPRIEP